MRPAHLRVGQQAIARGKNRTVRSPMVRGALAPKPLLARWSVHSVLRTRFPVVNVPDHLLARVLLLPGRWLTPRETGCVYYTTNAPPMHAFLVLATESADSCWHGLRAGSGGGFAISRTPDTANRPTPIKHDANARTRAQSHCDGASDTTSQPVASCVISAELFDIARSLDYNSHRNES